MSIMKPTDSVLPWTRQRRWPLAGFLFGLLFPILGTIMEVARGNQAFSLDLILKLQTHEPLLWIIDLAPITLGIVGWFILTPRGTSYLSTTKARFLPAFLSLLAVIPLALLAYALEQEAMQSQMVADANRSGSLRYRSLWLYGATQGSPSIPAKDAARWQTVLREMVTLRDGLRRKYPEEIARTDTVWSTFFNELKQKHRVSWASANKMRSAADTLSQEIEEIATRERAFTLMVLSLGMLGVVVSLMISLDLLRHMRHSEFGIKGDHTFIEAVLNTTRALIVVTDPQGRIVRFNRAAELLTGYSAKEVVGQSYTVLLAPDEVAASQVRFREITVGEFPSSSENHWMTKAGVRRLLAWSTTTLLDEDGDVRFVIGTAVDITEQREQENRLEALATTDGLTGVGNRRALDERLALETARSSRYDQPLSLIVLDIDHFKSFNDTFGHQAGDEVLRQVAATLSATARETDYVARYGGEEFLVILPHTDYAESIAQAERMRNALERAHWPQRAITGSFGVATWSTVMTGGADLVSDADRALYQAKKTRNAVRHAEERYTLSSLSEERDSLLKTQ